MTQAVRRLLESLGNPELRSAVEVLQHVHRDIFSKGPSVKKLKGEDREITTNIDLLVQSTLVGHLRKEFPRDVYCAEETAEEGALPSVGSKRCWFIDPIDGTQGYFEGTPEYSVLLGFVDDAVLKASVVFEPAYCRYTVAVRGAGCWTWKGDELPERCKRAPLPQGRRPILVQSHRERDLSVFFSAPVPRREMRFSAGVKMAMVARSEADAYLTESPLRPWDICAGTLLVEEAGGTVTDMRGVPFSWTSRTSVAGVVAACSTLHATVVARANQTRAAAGG